MGTGTKKILITSPSSIVLRRRDLSVLTSLSFPKLVLGIPYRLESEGVLFFQDIFVLSCCFTRLMENQSFQHNVFDLIVLFYFFIAWTPLAMLQSSSVRAAASAKTPNAWQLWRFCLLSLNPMFFYGMSLFCVRVSHQGWAQVISLSSEIWAIMLKDSAHWLKAVTVLVMPTIPPPISQFH